LKSKVDDKHIVVKHPPKEEGGIMDYMQLVPTWPPPPPPPRTQVTTKLSMSLDKCGGGGKARPGAVSVL
jgi:hypothetical protein